MLLFTDFLIGHCCVHQCPRFCYRESQIPRGARTGAGGHLQEGSGFCIGKGKSPSLIRIRKVFTKHHSRDSCFLSRIAAEIQAKMAAEEAYPWVCPCGRLNKKSADVCAVCWGHWTKGKKHDVTPKPNTYGGTSQWSESWDKWDSNWEQSQKWEDWAETESVRQSSQSPRGRSQWQDTLSPRQRNAKGKGKGKWKNKGMSKAEASGSPFGQGKGGFAPLPPWPAWNAPEPSQSPFQAAQSGKNSTMQEMAAHLRHATKRRRLFLPKCKHFWRKRTKSTPRTTSSRCMRLPRA